MRQRQGTILKKCRCANQDRCSHKWTPRYWADGRQRELSFADELDGKLPVYSTYRPSFNRLAREAGIPEGFTPHSLRHAFVSALLSRGVPITDVAKWLGHRNINVTYATYGPLVPSSLGRAQEVLNAEYAEWSKAA